MLATETDAKAGAKKLRTDAADDESQSLIINSPPPIVIPNYKRIDDDDDDYDDDEALACEWADWGGARSPCFGGCRWLLSDDASASTLPDFSLFASPHPNHLIHNRLPRRQD